MLKLFYINLFAVIIVFFISTAFFTEDDEPVRRNDELINFSHSLHYDFVSCDECHSSVPGSTSLSDRLLPDHDSCVDCHDVDDDDECETCHKNMVVQGSRIDPPEKGMTGIAPGYMDAMHGLCIACHEEKHKKEPARFGKWFATCANCHRDVSEVDLKQMAPYVATRP